MTGLHLAQYRIDAELGRGGMGIVYRATDTKLNRTVALKVLPASALASGEDRARFFREAQAAAQLSHPNVCHVYQVDEAVPHAEGETPPEGGEKRPFIAMEFIEGETLQERVAKSPLKLTEAVSLAAQIAEALRAAHAKDIVHRDIKSANVMLTTDGVAKVLDFGLAKTQASTMLTRQGSTLGTVAYMSPEQARGQEVDGRTDLYSLGTVLYEMIAGRLPFEGDYEQAVVYGILNENPEPLTALRTGVPMGLEWIVNKLLSKEPRHRYQTAGDLVADLETVDLTGSGHSRRSMSGASGVLPVAETAADAGTVIPTWMWGVVAAAIVLGLGAGWLLFAGGSDRAGERPIVRSEIILGGDRVAQALSISPDGSHLAYSDAQRGEVWIRDLATGDERRVPEAIGIIELDYSPSGRWLLLDQQNAILRAPSSGGTPVLVRSIESNAPHSSWVDDETILFDDPPSIYRLSLADGTITAVASADTTAGELRLLWGRLSSDRTRLFTRLIRDPDSPALAVYSYPDGERLLLDEWDAIAPRYVDSGHLLVLEQADLMARPFDLSAARFAGPSSRIAESMSETSWDFSRHGQFVFAPIASFQFSSSSAVVPSVVLSRGSSDTDSRLLELPQDRYSDLRVSPDGRRVAAEILDAGAPEGDVWVIDLETLIREQLTFDNTGRDPGWSPDGDSLVVVNRDRAGYRLEVLAADGSGSRRLIREDSVRMESPHWSGAAGRIVIARQSSVGRREIWFVDPLTGEIQPAVRDGGQQSLPKFSPDGRYFAFESDQRVIVRTTSLDGGEWDISQGMGETPYWSADGSSIYFARNGELNRVQVQTEGRFSRLGNPEFVIRSGSTALYYSPIPGSDEFLYVTSPSEVDKGRYSVTHISNIEALIGRLAPTAR